VVDSFCVSQHPRRLFTPLTVTGPLTVAVARQLPLPAAQPPSEDTQVRDILQARHQVTVDEDRG